MSFPNCIQKSVTFLLFLTTLITHTAGATIRLPHMISSNMVLQQKSKVNLWGWSNPAQKIFITTSWDQRKDSVVADGNAKWNITLNTPAAGGPYTITLSGENQIVLDNILIGEVLVCSGQSNMEWSSNQKLPQILEEMPRSANNNLRLFQVPKTTSAHPQDDLEGGWKVSGPEALKGFSAVGYFFAKALQQKLNVPVGIINSSWGGTPAETWTPEEALTPQPSLLEAASFLKPSPWWPVATGYAYNAMIAPLTPLSIAGVIWYQGESNTMTYSTYSDLFTTMIQSWRKAWQQEFPFYYVQIAPYTYGNHNVGNLLREQQSRTLSLPNTGMVVISDLVDNVKDIHPKNKKDVAARLANYALAETYHQEVGIYKSPVFERMEISGSNAHVYFDNAPNGFRLSKGTTATEFYIAGADKVFVPATVKIETQRLVLSHPKVKAPIAVRFSFSNTAMSNIFSKEGLPIAPFRTDNWTVDTSKVK